MFAVASFSNKIKQFGLIKNKIAAIGKFGLQHWNSLNIDMTVQASPDYLNNFVANICLDNPLKDYKEQYDKYVCVDVVADDDVLQGNHEKLSKAAEAAVWKLLFDSKNTPSQANQRKASDLLQEYKSNAAFQSPWSYNDWIVTLRDELLKREYLDFWKNEIVANELGLCWARDSDYFDDMTDTAPAEFYNHGGCTAPFKPEPKSDENTPVASPAASPAANSVPSPAVNSNSVPSPAVNAAASTASTAKPVKISLETPLADYNNLIDDADSVEPESQNNVFRQAQQIIWQLLFEQDQLSKENYTKAAQLLAQYKKDACFYNPFIYNEWIVKLRDEICKRKFTEFWQEIVVKQLGPCSSKDSDYFDAEEDTKPIEFYNIGNGLLKAK